MNTKCYAILLKNFNQQNKAEALEAPIHPPEFCYYIHAMADPSPEEPQHAAAETTPAKSPKEILEAYGHGIQITYPSSQKENPFLNPQYSAKFDAVFAAVADPDTDKYAKHIKHTLESCKNYLISPTIIDNFLTHAQRRKFKEEKLHINQEAYALFESNVLRRNTIGQGFIPISYLIEKGRLPTNPENTKKIKDEMTRIIKMTKEYSLEPPLERKLEIVTEVKEFYKLVLGTFGILLEE